MRSHPFVFVVFVATAVGAAGGCNKRSAAMKAQPSHDSTLSYATLVAQSMEELRIKTGVHERLIHLGEADWHVDQDTGLIKFTINGIVATAPVQIIGTYNTADGTWHWGWANPSVEPKLAAHAGVLRDFGAQRDISELTNRKLPTTEDKCWEFTALACKLAKDEGAYRGPAGDTLVFMTFGELKIEKAQ